MILDGAPVIVDPEQAVEMVTGLLADQGFAFGKPTPPRERAVDLTGESRRIYDAITEGCTVDNIAANGTVAGPRGVRPGGTGTGRTCCRIKRPLATKLSWQGAAIPNGARHSRRLTRGKRYRS
jgi:hypothetical protein